MNNKQIFLAITYVALLLTACEDENFIPKPPTYLRLELPNHTYKSYEDPCGFSFDLAELYSMDSLVSPSNCNRKIDLGPLNGTLFIYYWDMDQPLSYYVNNANDEVGNHKLKATLINDERLVYRNKRVFGTRFELQGDVATPFQFYLTDSTERFLYAEVLFNSTPNYDSMRPTLDYFKKDLEQIIKSFKWR